MARPRKVGNLLALGLLTVLMFGRPMHPYDMAGMLRRTGKERDLNIKWGSLYTVVQNLEKHGFIVAIGTDRAGGRPERTMYAITEAGQAEARDWLRELVAEPEPEHPRFEAALSLLAVLPPDEVVALLEQRVRALDAVNEADQASLTAASAVPRVFLVEMEHGLAMRRAEAAWVRGLLVELRACTLSGVDLWRRAHETGHVPDEWTAMLESTTAEAPGQPDGRPSGARAARIPPAKAPGRATPAKTPAAKAPGRATQAEKTAARDTAAKTRRGGPTTDEGGDRPIG